MQLILVSFATKLKEIIMTDRLAKENIWKLILQFSIPAVVGQVVFALYNIVDRMFIGQELGTLAISSISVTLPIFTIITAFGMFIGIGSSSKISLCLGQGRKDVAERVIGNAIFVILVFNTLIMLVGYTFMDEILRAVGATESMIPIAASYMKIIYFFIGFQFIAMGLNGMIRAEGSPKKAMIVMLSGAILNIFLDYLFVIVFKWGVEGAALATKISSILSACLTLYHFTHAKKRQLTLRWSALKPDFALIKSVLKIGFPLFILQIGVSLAASFANSELKEYGGEMAIGAMGVISSIYLFTMLVNTGITQGIQPLIGYNYGHQSYSRVRKLLRISLCIASTISLIIFIPILVAPSAIVALFSDGDVAFMEMTVRGMQFFLMGLPLVGYNIIGSSYFQSIGKPKKAGILFFLKQIIFYMGSLLILPIFLDLDGVFLSGTIAEILLFIILAVFLYKEILVLKEAEREYDINQLKINPIKNI